MEDELTEEEESDLFWGPDGELYQRFYDDDFEDTCGAPWWADEVYRANELPPAEATPEGRRWQRKANPPRGHEA